MTGIVQAALLAAISLRVAVTAHSQQIVVVVNGDPIPPLDIERRSN
jgi:hypothetical protein